MKKVLSTIVSCLIFVSVISLIMPTAGFTLMGGEDRVGNSGNAGGNLGNADGNSGNTGDNSENDGDNEKASGGSFISEELSKLITCCNEKDCKGVDDTDTKNPHCIPIGCDTRENETGCGSAEDPCLEFKSITEDEAYQLALKGLGNIEESIAKCLIECEVKKDDCGESWTCEVSQEALSKYKDCIGNKCNQYEQCQCIVPGEGEVCCEEKIVPEVRCCGGKIVSEQGQVCCEGKIVPEVRCCGGKISTKANCCNGVQCDSTCCVGKDSKDGSCCTNGTECFNGACREIMKLKPSSSVNRQPTPSSPRQPGNFAPGRMR